MEEFLNNLGEWMKQAYVYIPAILSFISAIGFPSLVQISKIVASVKLYVTQIQVILKKLNETVEAFNDLADFVLVTLDEDAAFFEELADTTYNKKQQQAYLARASAIRSRRQAAIFKIDGIRESQIKKKKKIKVKVRVKPEEPRDEERPA